MENNNLYVNVAELLGLLDCIQVAADSIEKSETIQEVINLVHDLRWKEINDEEKEIPTIWNGRKNKAVNQ